MNPSPARSAKAARKQSASNDAMAAIFGDKAEDYKTPKPTARQALANVGFGGMGLLNHNRNSPMHVMTAPDLDDFVYSPLDKDKAKEKTTTTPEKGKDKQRAAENLRPGSGDSDTARAVKDQATDGDADEEAVESSENESKSSDDEASRKRGRGRSRTSDASLGSVTSPAFTSPGSPTSPTVNADSSEDDHHSAYGESKSTKQAKSALAAAEEERMIQSKAKLRQNEPQITLSGPMDDKSTKSNGVHPANSYDMANTEQQWSDSSEADVSDIRRAQKLAINVTDIDDTVPNRGIRTVIRGDFQSLQEEAEEGLRRMRTYVVAIDLSPESVYALEWTIGTTLRDGDTMICIYAVEEEAANLEQPIDNPLSNRGLSDGARAARDTMSTMLSQTTRINAGDYRQWQEPEEQDEQQGLQEAGAQGLQEPRSLLAPSSYTPATDSRAASTDGRKVTKAEAERARAIEDISQTCFRLLRKTKLQVRLAIECVHCRSPKHLIIEAIDGIEPTMVIVGSRGRSNVKGVLLGSFSNYILQRAACPTMVARAKLKKHNKAKGKGGVRMTNNLQRPNRLTTAKVD